MQRAILDILGSGRLTDFTMIANTTCYILEKLARPKIS